MAYILGFHHYVLGRYRRLILSVVVFGDYCKFSFHLAIVHCLMYFLYGTCTGDYMLTYSGITFYLMLSYIMTYRIYLLVVVVVVERDKTRHMRIYNTTGENTESWTSSYSVTYTLECI